MAKPIRVWLTPPGPNPWKVVTILEELGVPYEVKSFKFDDVKKKPYTDINPNGRAPAIEDPNHDVTVWETGAIIQYLIEYYDTKKLLSYDTVKEKALSDQYLFFQASGQGPYWGQATWFTFLHPEKVPSAIERYVNEVKRVLGVLEGILSKKGGAEPWLVGDRITYADLAWVPWNHRLDMILGVPKDKMFEGFPTVQSWHERMIARPSWIKANEIRTKCMDEQGLDENGMPKGITNFQEYEAKIAAGEDTTPKDL